MIKITADTGEIFQADLWANNISEVSQEVYKFTFLFGISTKRRQFLSISWCSSLQVKRQGTMSYIIFIFCVTFYSNNALGNTHTDTNKYNSTTFLKKNFPSHLKPKNFKFEFLLCNPPRESSINTFVLLSNTICLFFSVIKNIIIIKMLECPIYLGVCLKKALRKHISDTWFFDTKVSV